MIHDIRTNYMNKISQSYVFIHFIRDRLCLIVANLVPRAFPLKKWVGREKALASAGHVYSLNIPEKLIYMQPAGFALTERSNNGK